MRLHIPPKYNQYGKRQLWVIETDSGVDEYHHQETALHELVEDPRRSVE